MERSDVAVPQPRRRGRPYRPAIDPSPYTGVVSNGGVRMSWLLGTTRLHGHGGRYANRRDFVPALEAAGLHSDESRVSRWESGSAQVGSAVATGYEAVLGLPHGLLRSVGYLMHPPAPPVQGAGAKELGPADYRELDRLIDVCLDGSPTGQEWLSLSDALAGLPGVFLRSQTWRSLGLRLLCELCRSLGVGYATRLAALRRLLTHPMAQHQLVLAIGEFVMDPASVRLGDAIATLQHVPGKRTTALVMRLLGSDNEAVRRGAARCAAAMLAAGTFGEAHLADLEAAVIRLIGHGHDEVYLADVVRRMPDEAARRILQSLRGRPMLEVVLRHGESVAPTTSRQTAASIAAAAQYRLATSAHSEPDQMLERLIREAMFHAHAERRSQAGTLLMASPYAQGIARACAEFLNGSDAEVSARAAALMRYCVTADELPVLLAAAADSSGLRSDVVRRHATVALAHAPAPLEREQAALLAHRAAPWNDRLSEATIYSLGMHGHAPTNAPGAPGWVREAAAWWADNGPRRFA